MRAFDIKYFMKFSRQEKQIFAAVFALIFFFAGAVVSICLFNPYPLKYKDEIIAAAGEYDSNPAVVAALINAESGFDKDAVSQQGAVGLMQIMPTTAAWVCGQMGTEYNKNLLTDPQTNIQIGTYYLNYLLQKFVALETALAAYNAGEGNVLLWLENPKYSPDNKTLSTTPFRETNAYVQKILASIEIYEHKLNK